MALRFAEPAAEARCPPLTIGQLLNGVLTKAADQQIVYRDRTCQSYRDLIDRIGRLASLLRRLDVEAGTTVAVMDWDSHRYLEAYFAVPMMGAVLQTVNVRMPATQIAYSLRHAGARILLVHRDFFPIVEEILPDLPDIQAVIAIIDDAVEQLPAWADGEYEQLSAAASPYYPFEDFDENALATTFYTSGTTGLPKGVCFSHRQIVLHTLAVASSCGASGATPGLGLGDVYMPLTPMFHVHAWGMPYVATMLGVKQVYPGRYEPEMICRLRREHMVTYSHCVPTVLQMVINHARSNDIDVAGWKMTIGGSAMTRSLCAEARSLGMGVGAGYGMSETCPILARASFSSLEQADNQENLLAAMTVAGIPAPLTDLRIVDEAMNFLPHDGRTRGELVARAPWLTPCYTGDPAASQALWRGGWLHTQDIATIDAQGQLQIRDRLKDVIKTGGEWVDSLQLEELVATAPDIVEAAVVAVPDPKWGERPLAVVVPKPGAIPTLDTINVPVEEAIAQGAITRYARLDRIKIVDQLPRTSVGKIDKKLLRALYADDAG